MTIATLTVYGTPTPQGSKTPVVRGGKAHLIEGRRPEARRRFADWRAAVRAEAQRWIEEHPESACIDGPVAVSVVFFLPRPPSKPKWRRLPWERPDGDKLLRCVLDAITGVLISDDARAVDMDVHKRWSEDGRTGCTLLVRSIDERTWSE